MHFTDPPLSYLYAGGPSPQLPDTTWRFSSDDDSIVPNGIRANAEQTKMFATDTLEGALRISNAVGSWASNVIYVYDIDGNGLLGNKRMFDLTWNGLLMGFMLVMQGEYGQLGRKV